MAPKKKAKATTLKAPSKQAAKKGKGRGKLKTSGEKPINPLVLAPGVRTSQTTI